MVLARRMIRRSNRLMRSDASCFEVPVKLAVLFVAADARAAASAFASGVIAGGLA
jgi:hypothetical protein